MENENGSNRFKNTILRIALYALGMATLALGITLNTKTVLGVSPIISVAYCFSELLHWDLGNTTFLWYAVFVATELLLILLKRSEGWKQKLISTLLQLPISLIFTRLMNLFALAIPSLESLHMAVRLLLLILAVVLTGIGAALSLDMRVVPNPGEGVVQAISDFSGAKTGTVKNLVDLSCVLISACVGLLAAHRLIGIGIGTLAAALGVGRVVWLFQRLYLEKTERLLEKARTSTK